MWEPGVCELLGEGHAGSGAAGATETEGAGVSEYEEPKVHYDAVWVRLSPALARQLIEKPMVSQGRVRVWLEDQITLHVQEITGVELTAALWADQT
jgi:hypothetical protein